MSHFKQHQRNWLQELNDAIDDNLQYADFTVSSLAIQMNLSVSSLYRKIQHLCNISPREYIKQRKLEKAHQLLESGACTNMKNLAKKVGFIDVNNFTNNYKAVYQQSVKNY